MIPFLVVLIPALPLAGWAVNGLWGARLRRAAVAAIACGTVAAAFVASVGLLWWIQRFPLGGGAPGSLPRAVDLYSWIATGPVQVPLRLIVDQLSVTMGLVVSGVGLLIHVYSVGYMAEDPGFARYFAYLNLFMASMLTLVLAGNLVVMFIGWEGVGLCSYLLIAFWYARPQAAAAGVKAFLVTRLGDVGFLLGIFLAFGIFGTTDFVVMTREAAGRLALGGGAATALALLLFAGAAGKSAQLPLHVWLPDAMEGPTPVSALIHAATMVTAGVYLIVRLHAVFLRAPLAMDVIAAVGAVTAVFAAASALVEPDLKRVLAYSTISQLGYMFLAVGVGAFGAGIFHLTSHAFFKALLFLAAGSVMHALGGETDMRRMGGLGRRLPQTAAAFAVGGLALVGIPPLSGFFSKDLILSQAFHARVWLWGVGVLAAGLTAVYTVRAYALTFLGTPTNGARVAAHDPPPSMRGPMWVLTVLAAIGGALGWSFGRPGTLERFLHPVLSVGGEFALRAGGSGVAEGVLVFASVAVAFLGVALGWLAYVRRALRGTILPLAQLLSHQFYIEALYAAAVTRPARSLARLLSVGDRVVIDGAVVGVARTIGRSGEALRSGQTGYLRHYAAFVLVGALLILVYWMWR
ncbi:MAG TPA: NADH-quinone oxidoreductase subunit L [bacterium]|nr:NADH-quinone oxidoreductase subunit L [bacterium]